LANAARLFERLLALGRYGFPFAWGSPPSQIVRLRRHNLQERFRSRSRAQRAILYLFCSLAYPLLSALEVRRTLPLLRRTHPAAGLSAALRMLGLALCGNVPPFASAFYGFEDPARRFRWPQYLFWTDRDALKMLNRLRGADPREVQDKALFAAICQQHNLPHATVLAEFRVGRPAGFNPNHFEPGAELWVKPIDLQAGRGAECWCATPNDWESTDGRHLSAPAFLEHLQARPCIVQRRLRNHPALDPITNGWLATLRIVVALRRDGTSALLGNSLGLPYGSSITCAQALVCAVDWQQGVIIQTQDPGSLGQPASQAIAHPDTGHTLHGSKVPFWQESLDLVQRAHRLAFPNFATLGWDVVITPDGPLLLETNSGWDDHHLQAVFGPLGKTILSEIIADELPL
jgi:hypothetical protein